MTHTIATARTDGLRDDIGIFFRGRDVAPMVDEHDRVILLHSDTKKSAFRSVPDAHRQTLADYLNGPGAEQIWSAYVRGGGLVLRMHQRDDGYMRGGSPVTIGEVS